MFNLIANLQKPDTTQQKKDNLGSHQANWLS